jgi:hypothetical protein
MQGYAARLGFGMTLTRNQIRDPIPRKKKASLVFLMDLKKVKSFII